MHLITENVIFKNILGTDSVLIMWFTYCFVSHNEKILISCLLKQKSGNYGDSSNALQTEPHVDCHDYAAMINLQNFIILLPYAG